MAKRLMPKTMDMGHRFDACIGEAIMHYEDQEEDNTQGLRSIMGYFLPTWQRGLVWTKEQNVKLIESLWLGLPIGTYTFNRLYGSKYDNLLIDGQQRMNAVQLYLEDEFEVFGYKWSETTTVDKRFFRSGARFGCYITKTDNEQYLRDYYNLMNFGGTAHKDNERA